MAKENRVGILNSSQRGNSIPRPRMLILAPTRLILIIYYFYPNLIIIVIIIPLNSES